MSYNVEEWSYLNTLTSKENDGNVRKRERNIRQD